MRGVVREIEEERPLRGGGPFAQVRDRPFGEQVGGVAGRVDRVAIEPHQVVTVPPVRRVALHHVAEETMEVVEAAVIGHVGGDEAEVPLADDGGVVARLPQFVGERRNARIEVAP